MPRSDENDPNRILDAEDVLCLTDNPPEPDSRLLRRLTRQWVKETNPLSSDPFGDLPAEIRLEIAECLQGVDFYNIRLASRSMSALFFNQSFWKSRFEIESDRGFISCLTDEENKGQNWQLLYHCSNASHRSPYLNFRKEVWDRARWLRDICVMTAEPGSSNMCRESLDKNSWDWREVQAQVHCDEDLPIPCVSYARVTWKQGTYISESLTKISVSLIGRKDILYRERFITEKDACYKDSITYVTGLKFISDDKSTSLGYSFSGSWVVYEVKQFKGFEVAISMKGIHALRIIANDDYSSPLPWVGNPHEVVVTNRLVLQHKVDALEAGFDVSSTQTQASA